jgi:hypothetical protein
MTMLTTLFLLLIAAFVVRWVVFETRGGDRLSPAAEAEVARLRTEVDVLTSEVRRLVEEQSFMVALLSDGERQALRERGGEPPALPPSSQPGET